MEEKRAELPPRVAVSFVVRVLGVELVELVLELIRLDQPQIYLA